MAPTLVHVAVGVLLGVALLGAAFDRRSLAVVALAAAVPDAVAAAGFLVPAAIAAPAQLAPAAAYPAPAAPSLPEAATHTAAAAAHSAVPVVAAVAVLYRDTTRPSGSRLRGRYGPYAVRVAWVAVASYAVAGIGLDLFSPAGAAVLYPLWDGSIAVDGRFLLSTREGVVQTYVSADGGWLGSAAAEPAGGERRLRLVESGWQLALVAAAAAAAPAKVLLERGGPGRLGRGGP